MCGFVSVCTQGLPPPLSARDLKIAGMEFVEAYSARNHLAEQVLGVRCWRSATFAEHYRHVHKIATLRKVRCDRCCCCCLLRC